MRPIIYVAAGLILLIVVALAGGVALIGGGVTWVATKKVDVSDPNAADTFRTKFEQNCSTMATKRIDKQDYQKIALVKQVCSCDAKALIAYMRRNKDMTILELEKRLLTRDAAIIREFDSCNKAYGVDVEPD
ncbi:hypothetical protein [Dongia sp.]|uniref:hypothetical protein n=1 Tax=Dongia sp. TaxID=1977262 RepID=UPI0037528CC4